VLAVLAVGALGYERAGLGVAAGLFGFVSLVAFTAFVGSLFDLIGLLDEDDEPIEGFSVGLLLLELVTLAAAVGLLRRFRFPLFMLVVATTAWLFLVDLISNGGDWSAVVSILVGVVLGLAGSVVEPAYGFWLHVVAGLSVGGGFLFLWHSADWEWVLIGIVALVYFSIADRLDRSSYAVVGAVGLLLAWSHFVEDWFGDTPVFFLSEGEPGNDVARAVLYAAFGLVLVVIGVVLERRRRGTVPPADVSPAVS